jgi:prevent-host-death family protein
MNTFTATDAKNRFGELLEAVHREPIEIDKKGRPVAVMLSYDTYREMEEALGEAKKPSDLSWLSQWRETATLAPAASADDETAYHEHLDRKYGR